MTNKNKLRYWKDWLMWVCTGLVEVSIPYLPGLENASCWGVSKCQEPITMFGQYRKVLGVMVSHCCDFIEAEAVSACRRKQHKPVYSQFLLPYCSTPWTSIKQPQTVTTHNTCTNRHCCARFYTFAGQRLSKQLCESSHIWTSESHVKTWLIIPVNYIQLKQLSN